MFAEYLWRDVVFTTDMDHGTGRYRIDIRHRTPVVYRDGYYNHVYVGYLHERGGQGR